MPDQTETQPIERLIRLKEVLSICGVGSSTLYRWIEQGNFPKQRKLNGRTVAWKLSEVTEWINGREKVT